MWRSRKVGATISGRWTAGICMPWALSAICHREDVEAALRTPGFGGFQMLDLQDFSGQGTANNKYMV